MIPRPEHSEFALSMAKKIVEKPLFALKLTKEAVNKMAKYKCTVCGYIYDPEKGDPDGGIKPGTPFKDIPDDWVCPICGAAKDQFEQVE